MTAVCKGCGSKIVWAVSAKTGARLPLDLVEPCDIEASTIFAKLRKPLAGVIKGHVYELIESKPHCGLMATPVEEAELVFLAALDGKHQGQRVGLSHFLTCSKANSFSRGGK